MYRLGGVIKWDNRNKKMIISLLIILLILLVCILMRSCNSIKVNSVKDIKISGEEWDGKGQDADGKVNKIKDYIEIPGYSEVYAEDNSSLRLINPKVNDVLFKYTILDENDKSVFETDYIKPNCMVKWNVKKTLKKAGTYNLVFKITAITMDDNNLTAGGSTQKVKVNVY